MYIVLEIDFIIAGIQRWMSGITTIQQLAEALLSAERRQLFDLSTVMDVQ